MKRLIRPAVGAVPPSLFENNPNVDIAAATGRMHPLQVAAAVVPATAS